MQTAIKICNSIHCSPVDWIQSNPIQSTAVQSNPIQSTAVQVTAVQSTAVQTAVKSNSVSLLQS